MKPSGKFDEMLNSQGIRVVHLCEVHGVEDFTVYKIDGKRLGRL